MSHPVLAVAIAALAGGLGVYIYFATRPAPFDEPKYVYLAGARLQLVSGAVPRRRVLIALGAFAACLVFLTGSLSTLL